MENLSALELSEYKEVFSMFDKDGDGTIDAGELGTVMGTLGINPSDAEIQQMIEEVDTDKNGTIDFSEFCNLMITKTASLDPAEEARNVFKMIDKDEDGFISTDDLNMVIETIQWGAERAPRPEDVEMMLSLDSSNGMVDLEAFKKIVLKKYPTKTLFPLEKRYRVLF